MILTFDGAFFIDTKSRALPILVLTPGKHFWIEEMPEEEGVRPLNVVEWMQAITLLNAIISDNKYNQPFREAMMILEEYPDRLVGA